MKRSEFAMIILIASVSVLVAYFVAQSIFGSAVTKSVNVKTIEKIDSSFQQPDKAIFNSTAINPTVPSQITSTTSTSQ